MAQHAIDPDALAEIVIDAAERIARAHVAPVAAEVAALTARVAALEARVTAIEDGRLPAVEEVAADLRRLVEADP